jgi:hypothetical protein
MSVELDLIAMLKSLLSTTYNVYSGLVPESEPNSAVAVNNVANPSNRVISGVKYGRTSVWRITVVATGKAQRQQIIDLLETLDNTSNNSFQRVFVDLVNLEPKDTEDQPVVRAFVDITLR